MKTLFVDQETGESWTENLVRPPEPGEIISSPLPGKDRPYQVVDYAGGEGDSDMRVNVTELKPLPKIG